MQAGCGQTSRGNLDAMMALASGCLGKEEEDEDGRSDLHSRGCVDATDKREHEEANEEGHDDDDGPSYM